MVFGLNRLLVFSRSLFESYLIFFPLYRSVYFEDAEQLWLVENYNNVVDCGRLLHVKHEIENYLSKESTFAWLLIEINLFFGYL